DANRVHALELENAAAMGDDDTDALGAIHRAAAADRDDDVAALAEVQLGALHYLFHARVGRHLGVQAIGDALGLQTGLYIAGPAGRDHAGIGDDQHLACAEGLGVIADVMPGAGTKDELGGNELSQLIQFVAHTTA